MSQARLIFFPDVVAVIPALNEEMGIAAVVASVRRYAQTIVVDDGSSDNTAVLAAQAGSKVVSHRANLGYDRALESGFQTAIKLGYTYAISLDGDGQHEVAAFVRCAEELVAGADLVVGVRDKYQRWAEYLFGIVGQIVWGIRDPLSGLKGYRLDLLKRAGCFDTYGSIGTELAIRSIRSGCQVAEVPVATRARRGASRFGAGLRANLRIFRAMVLGIVIAKPIPDAAANRR